jgi:hypothetical protein
MASKRPNKKLLRRYTSLSALIQLLRSKELVLLSSSKWDDRNDAHFLSHYARRKNLGAVLAACFARAGETYHHWKVFSHGLDGVCIEFDEDRLRASLAAHTNLSFGDVQYRKLDELRKRPPPLDRLPFIKRHPFRDEREFRVIYDSHDPIDFKGFAIDLDCISRIMLSPWSTKPLADAIKATIHDIHGCSRLRVYRTTLIDNESWKNAILPRRGRPAPRS